MQKPIEIIYKMVDNVIKLYKVEEMEEQSL